MRELIATIHFLGLALFSTQVPDENGLRVLLPRIEERKVLQANSQQTVTMIERHDAYLIFAEEDVLQEIGWASEPAPGHMFDAGEGDHGARYRRIKLDGERLTFHATGDNAAVPPAYRLDLPKVSCVRGIVKNPPVAAMVRIPNGQLKTCVAATRPRYDTQLVLNNNGVITVWAEAPRAPAKAVVLVGDATVYVVNLPSRMFAPSGSMLMSFGAEHYNAYYDLLRTYGGNCQREFVMAASANVSTCPAIALRLAEPMTESVSSECSNSSWP